MAGNKGQGNGPATRARGKKRAASAQDKTEQLRDKFAKITKSQAEDLKSRDLDKLTEWLGEHPRAADFIWKSVEAGAYDYLDSGETSGTAEEEVLPAWQNKVSLLHPDKFVKPLLQELCLTWQSFLAASRGSKSRSGPMCSASWPTWTRHLLW